MMFNKSYNRYKGGTLIKSDGGDWVIPKREGYDTKQRPDDRFYVVREGDRLDLIAYRMLGDARLYWVICLYNDIFWILDIKIGQQLRIPSYNTLQMFILT